MFAAGWLRISGRSGTAQFLPWHRFARRPHGPRASSPLRGRPAFPVGPVHLIPQSTNLEPAMTANRSSRVALICTRDLPGRLLRHGVGRPDRDAGSAISARRPERASAPEGRAEDREDRAEEDYERGCGGEAQGRHPGQSERQGGDGPCAQQRAQHHRVLQGEGRDGRHRGRDLRPRPAHAALRYQPGEGPHRADGARELRASPSSPAATRKPTRARPRASPSR